MLIKGGWPTVVNRHGREHILRTVTELINSGPEASGADSLNDIEAVRRFIRDRQITEVREPSEADIGELHDLRRRLYSVFASSDELMAVQRVNELLASAPFEPRLAQHDNQPYHLHYFPAYASLGAHLTADCAMTLSILIADGEWQRMRICQSDDCQRAFVDFSRNRVRLYCDSRRCGNRIHVASYRARKRGSQVA